MMKKMIYICSAIMLLSACNKHDDDDPVVPPTSAERTVIVYMSGENNLDSYGFLSNDLSEMKDGSRSIPANNRLVVFADRVYDGEKPFIAEIKDGVCDTLVKYDDDFYACDPARFTSVIKTCMAQCPASEYALVLWGHATGWLISADSIAGSRPSALHRAYGADSGNNSSYGTFHWMNITQMARAMQSLPHFKFIFADCCAMMTIEVAYQLRHATDFLIGSPVEIPGKGAPYDLVTPDLFLRTDSFYRTIIDDYYNYYSREYMTSSYVNDPNTSYLKGHSVPLSVVDMRYVESLAQATRNLLQQPDSFVTDGVPFYFYTDMPIMYDMGCLLERITPDEAYGQWLSALDRAVPYRRFSARWMTQYSQIRSALVRNQFRFTEENYSGLSMFVPKPAYNFSYQYQYNATFPSLDWCGAVGWERFMK